MNILVQIERQWTFEKMKKEPPPTYHLFEFLNEHKALMDGELNIHKSRCHHCQSHSNITEKGKVKIIPLKQYKK
jgi:hypothetical protein